MRSSDLMALRLLADLGAGDHLCFVRPDAPARRSKDKQAQATLAIARRVVPLVQSWLTVRDAATRAAAVFFLALCDEEAAAAKAIASVARSDAAPAVRAGAAIALGLYARAGHAPSATVLAALEGDDHVAAGRWAGRVIAGMKFSQIGRAHV